LGSGGSHFRPASPGKPPAIRGRYVNPSSKGTLVHEFGHYLDWFLGGENPRVFASQIKLADAPAEVRAVMKAIGDSPEYDALLAKKHAGERNYKYLSSRVELFARAFEQYVAT